jgi:DNA-directed RNA polymerase beta subunit
MPWEGFNYEDAILISERLVFDDVYSSIHIERYETHVRKTKYGKEQITLDIPAISPNEKKHLNSYGITKLGTFIKEGHILVGKITPINKKSKTPYQRLFEKIVEKPSTEYKSSAEFQDSSLRAPKGINAKVINIFIYYQPLSRTIKRFFGLGVATKKTLISGRDLKSMQTIPHSLGLGLRRFPTKKGTQSEFYITAEQSPQGDRAPLWRRTNPSERNVQYNPSGKKWADVAKIQIYLAEKRKIQIGDKMAGRHGNKGIVSQILPQEDMPYLKDGSTVDMVLNPLGVPSRMNVGQIYECLLGLAGKFLGTNFRLVPFDETFGAEASRSFVFSKLFEARKKTGKKWLFNPNYPGKTHLFDGRTGEIFDQPVTVGQSYMLKLVHLVDDKIHSRSTGPYSLVTQQPLRGRSKQGGQRLGEMEVWAIEGYGAAFLLLELLTIKSDDISGRLGLWSSLLFNRKIAIGTPESFFVVVSELQSLCLDIGLFV